MKMIAILLHVTSRMQYDVFRTNSVIRMHFITTFDSFYTLFIFIYLLREREHKITCQSLHLHVVNIFRHGYQVFDICVAMSNLLIRVLIN